MLNDIYQALDPTAFSIGPFAVRWYGLGYILGVIIGGIVILKVAKRWRIEVSIDSLMTLLIAAILGIIIGGRLGYCLFYDAGKYLANPLEILAVNNGGMSFHGGVIGMLIAIFATSKITKIPFATIADLVVIAAPIGIFLVRVANFINGELWGAVDQSLPWGVVFDGAGALPRHPTQLYEALLEGVLMFVVLFAMSRKVPPWSQGTFVGVFLTLYGIFRITIEFVRQPDVQIGYLFGNWFTMGMLLSVPLLIAGIGLLVYAHKTKKSQVGLATQQQTDV
jgi:phosphatidylglycerol:prolipoprotein diacylglycerol transferase